MSCSNQLTFSIPTGATGDGDDVSPPLTIKLHHATDDDDDQGENETNTGFVMWPSAVMLAHQLTKPDVRELVLGNEGPDGNILELGAGCGLTGLTAAAMLNDAPGNDDKVIFTDYNPAVVENLRRNILLNEYTTDHKALGLDWFDQQPSEDAEAEEKEDNTWVDLDGKSHGQCRLILGADLIVCSNDAELVASTINCALMEGGQALILGASGDRRFGVNEFAGECRSLGLTVKVDEDMLESNERAREEDGSQHGLMTGLELGGYNQRACTAGHDFTMFTIAKPITTTVG